MMAFRYYYPAIDLSTVYSLYRSDKDVKRKFQKNWDGKGISIPPVVSINVTAKCLMNGEFLRVSPLISSQNHINAFFAST